MLDKLRTKLAGDIHLKEILTGSVVTFVLKMSGMLLGYLVILIITRQYGAEGVGVYSLTLSMLTLIAMISAMGMNVSILRYVGQFNKSDETYKLKLLYRYAVELVAPFSLLLALGLFFFADVIADNAFHNPVYKPALEFIAILVPFMALQNISVEFIRGLKQLKVSEFLRSVNYPLINIVLLLIGGLFVVDELLPLYTLGVGVVVSAMYAIYFIVKRVRTFEVTNINAFSKKELISTSLPMMVTTTASAIMVSVSPFMLEIYSATDKVGIFSVIFKIAMLISLVFMVVNTIAAPKISELYWKKEFKNLRIMLSYSSKISFFISLAIVFILMAFGNVLLNIFGHEFTDGYTALIVLSIGHLINSMFGMAKVLLNMMGEHKVLTKITIGSMFIVIILDIILIPSFNIMGASIAFSIGMIFLNLFSAFYVKIHFNYTAYYLPFKDKKEKYDY